MNKFISLIAISCLLAGCSNDPHSEYLLNIKKGIQASNRNEYSVAIGYLNTAINIDSTHGPAYIIKGKIESSMGNEIGAIGDFNKAIKINNKSTSAYFNRGLSYLALNKDSLANDDFDTALLTKSYGNFYFENTIADDDTGKVELDGSLAQIKFYKAMALYNLERDIDALKYFYYSYYGKYNIPECELYIGVILVGQGNWSKGCSFLKDAINNGNIKARKYYKDYCDSTFK